MKIVGCDLHTRYQQVAILDQGTGELVERRLEHESGEARGFYASLEKRRVAHFCLRPRITITTKPGVPHFSGVSRSEAVPDSGKGLILIRKPKNP
jgi:hypothetical protein